jgi:hypothetical protein
VRISFRENYTKENERDPAFVVKGDKERSVVSEEKGSAFTISYTLPLYKRNR